MIVVDANLIGNLLLQSKDTPLAVQVFEKDPDWYAPILWQSEVRSIVTSYFRHNLLTLDKAFRIMDEAHGLMLDHERNVSSSSVLELVGISKCTSYDCEYVALAKEMNLALVTFDKQVVGTFPRIAVFPQDFVNT
ncbi:MAG: type II toxin-antitoxin system VapC family toxin [Anaerolineales bacterium]